MSTIEKHLALQLIRNNGVYEDDPLPARIYEYLHTQKEGVYENTAQCYAVFYRIQDDDIWESPFVLDASLLWEQGHLTVDGEEFLRSNDDGSSNK